jgi:hypothetical protein
VNSPPINANAPWQRGDAQHRTASNELDITASSAFVYFFSSGAIRARKAFAHSRAKPRTDGIGAPNIDRTPN